ncbi:MAG: ATP-binding cassette domain-containing protein [Cypionkella sp.]|uniref:ABC transporter ATP-binding protein n=1 Tax=Cypionkella sp. TaxID=2811411 RepID=UPI002ABC4EFF|nr:ATP-binding cassette domain-containing protein [Cypionkella sp.]MDZ4310809.1 ATP-binding cassette domain-containing protein [Cypionkella sp.]
MAKPQLRSVDSAPVPAPPAFSFQGVSRNFGAKSVLSNIDLSVPQGQFVAIIGKSGCGKSTLLRLLAGLDQPDGGTINRAEVEPGQSSIRIMFQEPRLLPWARVVDNVAVGLTGLAGKAEAKARAHDLLAKVGLSGRDGEWPSVLSGGQRQRVALARALIGQPSVLALDEPLGALDALTRIEMQHLLGRIWQTQGFTAILVTHDVSEAVILADRVIVLDAGKVALDLAIPLARPRRHGHPDLAVYEQKILAQLFGDEAV